MIILRCLPDIDPALAKSQYECFRERFLTTFVGLPCVLEYPGGVVGPADVDSGPLILGRSLSATVLAMGVAQIYGDQALANAIAQTGETIGLPWTSQGRKQYVGGVLPIGSIIVAYSQVARPWFSSRDHHPSAEYAVSMLWRWKVHAISMTVFLPAILSIFRHPAKPI
jgi:hypothetical protein